MVKEEPGTLEKEVHETYEPISKIEIINKETFKKDKVKKYSRRSFLTLMVGGLSWLIYDHSTTRSQIVLDKLDYKVLDMISRDDQISLLVSSDEYYNNIKQPLLPDFYFLKNIDGLKFLGSDEKGRSHYLSSESSDNESLEFRIFKSIPETGRLLVNKKLDIYDDVNKWFQEKNPDKPINEMIHLDHKIISSSVDLPGNTYLMVRTDITKSSNKQPNINSATSNSPSLSLFKIDSQGNKLISRIIDINKDSDYKDKNLRSVSMDVWDNYITVLFEESNEIAFYDSAWKDIHFIEQDAGHLPLELSNPKDVAIGPNNKVYIADTGNNRIKRYNILSRTEPFTTHNTISKSEGWDEVDAFGSYGTAKGEFDRPTKIAINNQNDIYVYDEGNDRIQKIKGF